MAGMIYNLDGTLDTHDELISKEIAIKKPNLAFVVMDMQAKFTDDLTATNRDRLISSITIALDYSIVKDIPIFIIEHYGHGPTIDSILDAAKYSKSAKIYKKLEDNAFSTMIFPNLIRSYGINKLFFKGVNATGCVLASMSGARANRFEVMTASDVVENCGDDGWENHEGIKSVYDIAKVKCYETFLDFTKTLESSTSSQRNP